MPEDDRRGALEDRLDEYHGVSLAQVLGELSYLYGPQDRVLAGGSLVYGLGNRLSDLDIIIINDSSEGRSSALPLEHFVASLRVDVWRLSSKALEKVTDRVGGGLASNSPMHGLFGDMDDDFNFKLLSHVAFGIELGDVRAGARRSREGKSLASRLVAREFVERMRTSVLLAQLALRRGSFLTAVANARLAVEEAVIATMASRCLPFYGEKWTRDALGEHADLAAAYQPFQQLPHATAEMAGKFVDDAIAASTALWEVDLALEAIAPEAGWLVQDLEMMRVGDERFLVSARSGAMWSLEADEDDRWSALSSGAEVRGSDVVFSPGVDEGDLWDFCMYLHEQGLLEVCWRTGLRMEKLASMQGAL